MTKTFFINYTQFGVSGTAVWKGKSITAVRNSFMRERKSATVTSIFPV
jgi:hypothetical protein